VGITDHVLDASLIETTLSKAYRARDETAGSLLQLLAEDPRQLGGVEVQRDDSRALKGLIGKRLSVLN
jgi:hypothetical protein